MAGIRGTFYGKTCREHSPQTTEKISAASSKVSAASRTKLYLFLNLRRGNGQTREVSWEMFFPSHGGCSTLNIGESPSGENASTLSQILQVQVPEKYYLSPKACQGILRRASARGKELPEVLRIALERQAASA